MNTFYYVNENGTKPYELHHYSIMKFIQIVFQKRFTQAFPSTDRTTRLGSAQIRIKSRRAIMIIFM